MRRVLGLAVALLASGWWALGGAPKGVVEAGQAVYNVWRFENGLMRIICTGTAVATSLGPRLLTAGHCVEDNPGGRYYISRAQDPDALIRVRVEYWAFRWPQEDFAVLEFPEGWRGPTVPLCRSTAEVGEEVWAWTGPLGILPVLRSGIYSGPLHFPDDEEAEGEVGGMYFVQINGDGGSSGSGLLRLEEGKPCVWAIWVGGFVPRVKLDGALGVPFPGFLIGGE